MINYNQLLMFMKKTLMTLFIGILSLFLAGCVANTHNTYYSSSAYHTPVHFGYRNIHSDGLSDASYNLDEGRLGYIMNDYGFGGYDGGYYSREWIGR